MAKTVPLQDVSAPMSGVDDGESLARLIARYWLLLKRHYWILLLSAVVCVAGSYFWTQRQPRVYQATSKLVFHQSKPNIFGKQIQRVEMLDPGGRWEFEQFWNTQKEVLRSRWFAAKVVKREGLLDDPAFMPATTPNGKKLGPKERMRRAVDKVLGMSSVSLLRDSRVGVITVHAADPKLTARVANGIARAYVSYTREFQSSGVNQLSKWFDTYVSSKRKELDAAQHKVRKFERDHNILMLSFKDRQKLTASNMEAVSDQLRDVRAKLYAQQSLLTQINKMADSAKICAGWPS